MTTKETTAADHELARKILEELAKRQAASPPQSISKRFVDKMTSGIVDPDEARRAIAEEKAKKG
jgi:hypothetical protein